MSKTIIGNCTCVSEYQDKHYGAGRRVGNLSGKPDNKEAGCTVCGRTLTRPAVKEAPETKGKKKKKEVEETKPGKGKKK